MTEGVFNLKENCATLRATFMAQKRIKKSAQSRLKASRNFLKGPSHRKKSQKTKPAWDLKSRLSTESEVMGSLTQDLQEAWQKIRGFALSLGEQRNYASGKAVMFSRKVCYFFVRPHSRFLEVVIFLPQGEPRPGFQKAQAVTKSKWSHTYKVIHSDQVEDALTDSIREAYEICPVQTQGE